jgi:hypothetical protein
MLGPFHVLQMDFVRTTNNCMEIIEIFEAPGRFSYIVIRGNGCHNTESECQSSHSKILMLVLVVVKEHSTKGSCLVGVEENSRQPKRKRVSVVRCSEGCCRCLLRTQKGQRHHYLEVL